MASVDLSPITNLASQIKALRMTAATSTDQTVKALLTAQADAYESQMMAAAEHAQAQVESQQNVLSALDLHDTITAIGSAAPTILSLFIKR